MSTRAPDGEAEGLRSRIAALDAERESLERRLSLLQAAQVTSGVGLAPSPPGARVNNASSSAEKVSLFRRMFAGRVDVYPVRWENEKTGKSGYAPACRNEWIAGVCRKPQVKCGACPNQAFEPIVNDVIERHLRGAWSARHGTGFVAGVYPLRVDDTCLFLAADFDGESWIQDAQAYFETCRLKGVGAALERSRSGDGAHVWIFFTEPVAAKDARALGALILTATMERRPEVGFRSYDRFFPSQDTLPLGGFGNLIALPLQRGARDVGNSVFVDDALRPYDDQWALLSSLERLSRSKVRGLIEEAERRDAVMPVRMPVDDESEQPWLLPPSRRPKSDTPAYRLNQHVHVVLGDEIYIERNDLPPALTAQLVRLAAFQNPEFHQAQAMRLSTYGKPRVISCAELRGQHLVLPRGCLDGAVPLLEAWGAVVGIDDQRQMGAPLDVEFIGKLRPEQKGAFRDLQTHDTGVLSATTAFGKTVVAAALIAARGRNTLVLVHRRELMTQWIERLRSFLTVAPGDIGAIGGGRRKPTGRIDVALIQSLVRRGVVSDAVAEYGHLIVDECHHVSAASFELVARRAKARFVTGLSATAYRKDGHHPIIFMQCGPVRHSVSARSQAAHHGFTCEVYPRVTSFELPPALRVERPPMPSIYAALADDGARNGLIVGDIRTAVNKGRTPLVLTERLDHLRVLQDGLEREGHAVIALRGGMRAAELKAALAALKSDHAEGRIILATGRYLGEGFDDPKLDTLFLTMPISWKGTLAQYVGRLHREHATKTNVMVYDYVDERVPLLGRMAAKRRVGYRALGYSIRN